MTPSIPTAQSNADEWLPIDEVLAELKDVPRSTFNRWRATGRGPKSRRLPNGRVLIRRSALNEWLESLPE
ncbi:helix-turn-helix transcriptional regulator [Actinomadura kijaniata]|uniref:helix-turn-helix transcriptional regulator n=1 Tax=Actinomadura kijaniata TaxID=46161 RepID=UPI000A01BEE3|nr:helix-turn-helix domain-containing protein [Actinomadura kijaniata]